MIIDAKNLIVGRVAAFVAKKALLGEEISIVNCRYSIMTGKKDHLISEYKRKLGMGTWAHGPFYYRVSYKMVRRIIRGMLPYKNARGRDAFERIKCYDEVPEELKNEKMETVKGADVSKLPNNAYMPVYKIIELSRK